MGKPRRRGVARGVIVNLLTFNPPHYYDIALRDLGLFIGAVTLNASRPPSA
jgi:hypothetical protein